jgi:hypothetical protein
VQGTGPASHQETEPEAKPAREMAQALIEIAGTNRKAPEKVGRRKAKD